MMATVLPASANLAARDGPAWPVPMMMASKCFMQFVCLRPLCGVCPLPLLLPEFFHPGEPRCKQRTIPTSGALERSVRTCHDAPRFLAIVLLAFRHRNC